MITKPVCSADKHVCSFLIISCVSLHVFFFDIYSVKTLIGSNVTINMYFVSILWLNTKHKTLYCVGSV